MYSKNKRLSEPSSVLTPPPGYDGSRFRRRSDGRDDAFPLYDESVCDGAHRCDLHEGDGEPPCENECPCQRQEDAKKHSSLIIDIFKSIGREELIIIALILILAGERDCIDTETILLLALLLCSG